MTRARGTGRRLHDLRMVWADTNQGHGSSDHSGCLQTKDLHPECSCLFVFVFVFVFVCCVCVCVACIGMQNTGGDRALVFVCIVFGCLRKSGSRHKRILLDAARTHNEELKSAARPLSVFML